MMTTDESLRRQVRELLNRISKLEREFVGLRSERRPRTGHKRTRYQGVVSEPGGIPADGSGEVTIYKDGSPTTWKPDVWNVWMHGGQNAAYDTEVVVEFIPDKNRFELASQGCDAGGSHQPLT